jgi:hypothetical protein
VALNTTTITPLTNEETPSKHNSLVTVSVNISGFILKCIIFNNKFGKPQTQIMISEMKSRFWLRICTKTFTVMSSKTYLFRHASQFPLIVSQTF